MTASTDILSCLRESVRRFPNHPAVSDGYHTLTYAELWREAESLAEHLRVRGPAKGSVNLVEARAEVSFAAAMVGTYLASCVFAPYGKGAPAAFVEGLAKETARPFGPDVADLLFTTGTTGASKGVILSHRAAWASADNNRLADGITSETVYLIASPLNHVSALRKLQACFLVGAQAVLADGFSDLKGYYASVARHRVNALLLPPAAAVLLLHATGRELAALSDQIAVVHSNGAPLPEAVRESLRRCLPKTRLVFAYGATEAGSACCAYDYAMHPGEANCVGRPGPHATVTVEDGRLVVSGETVFDGYLNDPVRTAAVLRDKAVRTNDLGHIDEKGFVYVSGRVDDVINCGGLKVAPSDVESAAMNLPGISDCVCFGVPDRFLGSAVKLLVVISEDSPRIDLTDLRRFLQERLERHQLPSHIEFVDAIPRTPNGKPIRTGLR